MSDQNVQTVFSVRELIAVIPPPPAVCLRASAVVRAALAYPPVPRAREQRLRWWQMVPDLLRDGGILVARDAPQGQRRAAFWGALVYQLLWLMALIWLAYARFAGVPGGVSAQEGNIVEVEFIDRAESSAASASRALMSHHPAPMPLDAAPVSSPIAPAASVASQSRPPIEVPSPSAPALSVIEPEPDPVQIVPPEISPFPESPLQVTEVAEPDQEFTLHAPELSPLPVPPDLRVPTIPLQVTEIALQSPPPRVSTPPTVQIPPLPIPSMPLTEVTEREIPLLSVPTPVLSQVPVSAVTVPTLSDVVVEAELRDIPLLPTAPVSMFQVEVELPAVSPPIPALEPHLRPIPETLPEVSMSPRAAPDLPPGVTAQVTGPRATQQIKEREIALSPATVPIRGNTDIATGEAVVSARQWHDSDSGVSSAAPVLMPSGSASSTSLRDEWGQTQAATGSGLLDQAGRPRLAAGNDSNTGRLPPGTVVENYQNIDRIGTWLKRPPTGYQSSVFEQFWLPPENLLEEWVRRSIKTIYIPIPGTGKSIQCTVAFLMLGGGCGITDANLMDIEAAARKPPEIPFKPELHEDPSVLAAPPRQPSPDHQ